MSAKNDLVKLCERFYALQSDFYNTPRGIDELLDDEAGDLQEYLSLRNAGFREDEIRDMVGEEQFNAVQAIIERIRDNINARPRKAKRGRRGRKRRTVEVCEAEGVEAEYEPEEY